MFKLIPVLAMLTAAVVAAPRSSVRLTRRGDIDADAVVGFAQTVPDSTEGDLMLKWQPYLYVVDGCVPFPAVDADGDTRHASDLMATHLREMRS